MPRRAYLIAAGFALALVACMVAIAAWDPFSWHAHDAGYPSVTLLVAFAALVLVVMVVLAWLASKLSYPVFFLAGVTGMGSGILANVAGILTIHAMGGGNSAADIWAYPIIWYVGNPADASIVLGGIFLLAWAASLLLRRWSASLLRPNPGSSATTTRSWKSQPVNEAASQSREQTTSVGATNSRWAFAQVILVVVAAIPLLAVGSYGVARSAEITGWQPRPLEQLTRVVAHQAGLSESRPDRACASQFANAYHRPASTELAEDYCPRILSFAKHHKQLPLLVKAAPPSTFGRRPPAGPPANARTAKPEVLVDMSRNGTLEARLVVPPPPVYKPPRQVQRLLTSAQKKQLPCVTKAMKLLAPTEPRFEVLAIEALCRLEPPR